MEGSDSEDGLEGNFKIEFKRRSLKGKKKLCPRCLSDLRLSGELSGWLLPEEFFCEKCGYKGHVALEPMPKDTSTKE